MQTDSYAVVNSICFLDTKFIKQKLSSLSDEELGRVEDAVRSVFDLE